MFIDKLQYFMLKIRLNLRKVVAIAICLAVSVTMFAQDIITLKDGTEIQASVDRASVSNNGDVDIKFKKIEDLNGTTYLLAKSEISMIKYANGDKILFTNEQQQTPAQQRQNTVSGQQQSVTVSQSPMQKEKTYHWGIKGGLNIAYQMGGKWEALYYSRQGIHLGIFMEIPISAKVGFQPELMYSMQGMGERWGDGLTTKLDYIDLPLMFKFYVGKDRLSIDVGPEFGYMISAKISGHGRTVDVYDEDDWNKFDVSIGLGLSYKLNDNFDLSFRSNAGMTNVMKDVGTIRNAVGQLSVAYRF